MAYTAHSSVATIHNALASNHSAIPLPFGGTAGESEAPAVDRVVRQQNGKVTSRHIRCDTCNGWVDDCWYPRCHEVSREVPITGVSAGSQINADDGE